jgi:sugar lactone lactonase YvrE
LFSIFSFLFNFYLCSPKAGTAEVFMDNMAGLPDNINLATNGNYWVACFTRRLALLDFMHPYPKLKKLVSLIPDNLKPLDYYGLVLLVDGNGNVLQSLHDATGKTANRVSSAAQIDNQLFLGNTDNDWYNVYTLPETLA